MSGHRKRPRDLTISAPGVAAAPTAHATTASGPTTAARVQKQRTAGSGASGVSKYQLLSLSPNHTDNTTQSALSGCEPSMLLLLSHGHTMGLHFWQDVADPQRIMFDATQFNALAGYTLSKGIKGDFLARMKRKMEEHMR
jgi:hypothetical protein